MRQRLLIDVFAHARRTLANYVMWNMVMNRVSNLPKKFLDLRTDFNRVLFSVTSYLLLRLVNQCIYGVTNLDQLRCLSVSV